MLVPYEHYCSNLLTLIAKIKNNNLKLYFICLKLSTLLNPLPNYNNFDIPTYVFSKRTFIN